MHARNKRIGAVQGMMIPNGKSNRKDGSLRTVDSAYRADDKVMEQLKPISIERLGEGHYKVISNRNFRFGKAAEC